MCSCFILIFAFVPVHPNENKFRIEYTSKSMLLNPNIKKIFMFAQLRRVEIFMKVAYELLACGQTMQNYSQNTDSNGPKRVTGLKN